MRSQKATINLMDLFYGLFMFSNIVAYETSIRSQAMYSLLNGTAKFFKVFAIFLISAGIIVRSDKVQGFVFSMLEVAVIFFTFNFFLKQNVLLIIALWTIYFSRKDVRSFVKVDLLVRAIIFATVVLGSILGIFRDTISQHAYTISRHTLGFQHPNGLGLFILVVAIEAMIMWWENRKRVNAVFLSCLFLVGMVASSWGATISLIIMMLMYNSKKIIDHGVFGATIRVLSGFSWVIGYLASSFIVNHIDVGTKIGYLINIALSGRPSMIKYIFTIYTPKVGPQSLPLLGISLDGRAASTLWLDNTYLYVLLSLGILALVGMIIVATVFGLLGAYCVNIPLLVTIVTAGVYGMTEMRLTSLMASPIFIIATILAITTLKGLRARSRE